MTIKQSNVTIMVRDMDNAISFYESIGLKLKNRWGYHYAMLEGPGITVGIHPSEADEHNSGTVSLGFMIDRIEEAKEVLEKNNIVYKAENGKSVSYLHFKDLDGTIIYFVQQNW